MDAKKYAKLLVKKQNEYSKLRNEKYRKKQSGMNTDSLASKMSKLSEEIAELKKQIEQL